MITGNAGSQTPALWSIAETQAAALVMFSDEHRAQGYADTLVANCTEITCAVVQPSRVQLLSIMIECFRQSIRWAALDPDQQTARRLFDLREVLKAARKDATA